MIAHMPRFLFQLYFFSLSFTSPCYWSENLCWYLYTQACRASIMLKSFFRYSSTFSEIEFQVFCFFCRLFFGWKCWKHFQKLPQMRGSRSCRQFEQKMICSVIQSYCTAHASGIQTLIRWTQCKESLLGIDPSFKLELAICNFLPSDFSHARIF